MISSSSSQGLTPKKLLSYLPSTSATDWLLGRREVRLVYLFWDLVVEAGMPFMFDEGGVEADDFRALLLRTKNSRPNSMHVTAAMEMSAMSAHGIVLLIAS